MRVLGGAAVEFCESWSDSQRKTLDAGWLLPLDGLTDAQQGLVRKIQAPHEDLFYDQREWEGFRKRHETLAVSLLFDPYVELEGASKDAGVTTNRAYFLAQAEFERHRFVEFIGGEGAWLPRAAPEDAE
jgi:hypothetical protein